MGKMVYGLAMIFIIQLGLVLFIGGTVPGTSLYTFLTNPSAWDSSDFWSAISDVLLIGGAIGLVVGLYFIRNEWIVYASLSTVFASFGMVLVNLYQYVESQAIFHEASGIIASAVTGGLIIGYLMLVLDYSRGKD